MSQSSKSNYTAERVTTTGVIVDERSVNVELSGASLADVMRSQTITGYVTVDLVALDPRSGAPTTLNGVRVEVGSATTLSGFRKGQRFTVYAASYEDFRTRNVANITAVPAPEVPTVQNQSIPTPVKFPDPMGKFGGKPAASCERYEKTEQEAKSYMGFVADRSDLTIVQGKDNGRSPGLLIQQADGRLYLFDVSGQQHLTMGDHSVKLQTPLFHTGNADLGRTTFMFPVPMMENKVLDVVPNGTLLTPQPKLIINFLEALNLITSVMDLVRLGKVCYDAVRVLKGYKKDSTLQEQVARARVSATEVAYYGNMKDIVKGNDYAPPDDGEDVADVIVDAEED